MGHQFAGNHTFNGVTQQLLGRQPQRRHLGRAGQRLVDHGLRRHLRHRQPAAAQRPVLVAAQLRRDHHLHLGAPKRNINEVQYAALTGFAANGQQFQLRYNGNDSAPIVRGTNYTTAGVKAAIEAIAGWPAGGTVTVSALSDTAFTDHLRRHAGRRRCRRACELVNCSGGCTRLCRRNRQGRPDHPRRCAVTPTGNARRWSRVAGRLHHPGAHAVRADRQRHRRRRRRPHLHVGAERPRRRQRHRPDQQHARPTARCSASSAPVPWSATPTRSSTTRRARTWSTTNPTRVFPDMVQILANNTNAETGACPTASATPTADADRLLLGVPADRGLRRLRGVNASPLR